jgi:chromosomal replication initiation ATPase DnaA
MQGTITDEQARSAATQINAINQALAEEVGAQKYRIWFKNSTKMTLTGGYLKVGVPNLFIASWIENHFSNVISKAVRKVTGSRPKISFTIDPELSGSLRRTQLDSQAQSVSKAQSQLKSR